MSIASLTVPNPGLSEIGYKNDALCSNKTASTHLLAYSLSLEYINQDFQVPVIWSARNLRCP